MRKFYNFMRHFQLINWRIMVHSFNELKCILRGNRLEPSFNPQTIQEYMEDFKKGTIKPLPMGAYEYNCCVEYLKKIRHELFSNRDNFESFTLVFGKSDFYDLVIVPLEDCLEMVANEVGFKVTGEKIGDDKYEYTLESVL